MNCMKDVTDKDYNTIFYSICHKCSSFFGLLLAPYIGGFFNQPELVPLTKVMSSIVIIMLHYCSENTTSKKYRFQDSNQNICYCIISQWRRRYCNGFCCYGVWSLVGQQISAAYGLNTILLWVLINGYQE